MLTVTCGGLALSARAASAPRDAAVHQVELQAVRSNGSSALLQFEVVATSLEDARTAAASALLAIPAEAAFVEPGGGRLSASWLAWSWKWDASEMPVAVAYNPSGAPASVGPSAIIAALQAWSGTASSSFRYRYAGITNNVASILENGPDGENVVSWASLPCDRGCVLGITSKETAHEVDMLLNSNPEAAEPLGAGTAVDWRTVILHEFGHMAGLEHSCPVPFGPCTAAEADAVMFYQYRGILRKLAADDILGLAALYPNAAGPSPSPSAPSGPSPTPTPFPELVVIVEPGWNLVVLPAVPIAGVAAALTCIQAIYSFDDDAWRAWIRGVPASLQDITALEPNRAYWLHAKGECAHIFG